MNVIEQHRREPVLQPVPLAAAPGRRPRPDAPAAQAGPGRDFTTYYAVFRHPGTLWDPTKPAREQPFWDEHARYMDALFEAGEVVLGGPFSDRSGSLVIVRARDVRHAGALFRDDPWSVHDVLVAGEVKAWIIFLDGRDRQVGPVRAAHPSTTGDTR